MSMITEKRNEVASKLNSLIANRNLEIERRVNEFRAQLESAPFSDEILGLQKLLTALDEVISCEALIPQKEESVQPEVNNIVEATPEVVEPDVAVDNVIAEEVNTIEVEVNPQTNEAEIVKPEVEARPGMAYVGIPERR